MQGFYWGDWRKTTPIFSDQEHSIGTGLPLGGREGSAEPSECARHGRRFFLPVRQNRIAHLPTTCAHHPQSAKGLWGTLQTLVEWCRRKSALEHVNLQMKGTTRRSRAKEKAHLQKYRCLILLACKTWKTISYPASDRPSLMRRTAAEQSWPLASMHFGCSSA
jgi:hypothetical protein